MKLYLLLVVALSAAVAAQDEQSFQDSFDPAEELEESTEIDGVERLGTTSPLDSLGRIIMIRCTAFTCCPPKHTCCGGGSRCYDGKGKWSRSVIC